MSKSGAGKEIGITVLKDKDFSEWYIQVVQKAELADYSATKGFIVLRPYGFAIWERIQKILDSMIKKVGVVNAYFPLLIPESLLKKEAEHFKGFTPEVFWVTHAGDDKLGERLAIRPTSETIIYDAYSRWVRSWRDLPLLINIWNSVTRAEIKATKPFIRTSEFLWQEGHTVHVTKEDADKYVFTMLRIYKRLIEDYLAIPTIEGYKSEKEKFVGALYTTTLESIMPDGKALQMGTSHNLGQNFSKPFKIKYLGKDGKEHFAWTTSWGVSWRLIGALIMVHGDNKGLILPPKVAPTQVVIIPIFYSNKQKEKVLSRVKDVERVLRASKLRVMVDDREQYTPGWKYNEWELKGVPLRIEIGPRDIEKEQVTLVRRDEGKKIQIPIKELRKAVIQILNDIQKSLFSKAREVLKDMTNTAKSMNELLEILQERGGFVKACWCGSRECEDLIKEKTGADIRAIPFKHKKPFSKCIACGKKAKLVVYFARAY